jgi:hypothetical protein
MALLEDNQSVVAIQVGDKEPEILSDLSTPEIAELIGRHYERRADTIMRTADQLSVVSDEVIGDPDLTVEYYLLAYSRSRSDEALGRRPWRPRVD